MADDIMDEVDETESDEKLEDEVDETESGDETATSETSEDETDQSEGEEPDDSSSTDEGDDADESKGDESKDNAARTPEQIAKYERNRRKKAERELRDLKSRKTAGDESADADESKLQPGELSTRVWKGIVNGEIAEIAQDDPTINQRAGVIRDILFTEQPWLLKKKDGVKLANEIAIGRLVSTTSKKEPEAPVQRKTTPPSPRQPQTKSTFKYLTDQQLMNLSEDGVRKYEEALAAHLASQRK